MEATVPDVQIDDVRTEEVGAQEVAPIRFAISSYGADYTVDGLVKRIREGSVYVPKFQRGFVWDIKDAKSGVQFMVLKMSECVTKN